MADAQLDLHLEIQIITNNNVLSANLQEYILRDNILVIEQKNVPYSYATRLSLGYWYLVSVCKPTL
jgi:hypothetical protein